MTMISDYQHSILYKFGQELSKKAWELFWNGDQNGADAYHDMASNIAVVEYGFELGVIRGYLVDRSKANEMDSAYYLDILKRFDKELNVKTIGSLLWNYIHSMGEDL